MKLDISKSQAQEKIKSFFANNSFSSEEVKKIKRLAMKYKIKLGSHRRLFCKSCLSQLKGKTRIAKSYKTVVCSSCGYKNKFKIN